MGQLSKFWVFCKQIRCLPLLVSPLALVSCGFLDRDPACKVSPTGIAAMPLLGASLGEQELTLTFDRSPSENTEDISHYLQSRGIGGTFFIEGQRVDSPEIFIKLRDSGHLLGNGTLSHANLTASPDLLTEIRQVDDLLTPYVVGNIFIFRAPEGLFGKKTAEYLNRQGLQKYVGPIGWDVGPAASQVSLNITCSAESVTPKACAQLYFAAVTEKRSGILRFTESTFDLPLLLKELIPSLEAAGFKFARLDQVPDIKREILKRGGSPGVVGDEGGCNDYQSR